MLTLLTLWLISSIIVGALVDKWLRFLDTINVEAEGG